MNNPAKVPENKTPKLLWDFDIRMDHLIMARRPDHIITSRKKKNSQNCGLFGPGSS